MTRVLFGKITVGRYKINLYTCILNKIHLNFLEKRITYTVRSLPEITRRTSKLLISKRL